MKRIGLSVIASVMMSGSALAADSLFYSDVSSYNWGGFHAGVVGGAGMFVVAVDDYWCWWACDAPTASDWGVFGGITAGAQTQMGGAVFGVEADWTTGFSNTERVYTSSDDGITWSNGWDSLATLRGRAGLAIDNTLIYATGGLGLAYGRYTAEEFTNEVTDCTIDDCVGFNGWQAGLVAGVGIEHGVTENISVKAEYLAVLMPSVHAIWDRPDLNPLANDDRVTWTSSAHLLRAGLNFRF